MKINIRYCLLTAHYECDEGRHPQIVMRELDIKYDDATPQSIADQWHFWGCEIPPGMVLPKYLTEIKK